jgi:predicted DNA-binding transcriptional regulator AlpA
MSKKLLRTSSVAERYDRSQRTIDRWATTGDLPKPTIIRGHKYWDEEELDQFDDARKLGVQLT